MNEVNEFFIPTRVEDLENPDRISQGQYYVDSQGEFNVPTRQQLEDLTQLFDSLLREKSPTAIFSKPELFAALYSYVRAVADKETASLVTRAARHKICHEIGERLKKVLLVCRSYYLKNKDNLNDMLVMCLRSTVRMYVFTLCHVLLSVATCIDDGDRDLSQLSQGPATGRRRKRRQLRGGLFGAATGDAGIGEDLSGVDQDGRELALTGLVETCSPELAWMWRDQHVDGITVHLMLRVALHMATQKANIHCDGQSVGSALSVLFSRVCSNLVLHAAMSSSSGVHAGSPTSTAGTQICDLVVSPMVELTMRSEPAAVFFSRCITDMETEDSEQLWSATVIRAFFEGLASAAIHDVVGDVPSAKNVALCLVEVAKKSVSITVSMSDAILPLMQSESYEVRKAVITCISEMLLQHFNGHQRGASTAEERVREGYLLELLYRLADCNAFVRNHTLHMWERLADARAVPKRYYLCITEAIVGRLEDRNYLVRDSAMRVLTAVLRKNWYGHVLSSTPIREALEKARRAAQLCIPDDALFEKTLSEVRATLNPRRASVGDSFALLFGGGGDRGDDSAGANPEVLDCGASSEAAMGGGDANQRGSGSAAATRELLSLEAAGTETENREHGPTTASTGPLLSELAGPELSKIFFFEQALRFITLLRLALQHASSLLDSRTERDVVEAIKLIVMCCTYRMEGATAAFLKVLVMVYEGELKIQFAVRDAFVEVIFSSLSGVTPGQSASALLRNVASAQRLIAIMADATEGEINAIDRILGLIKSDKGLCRYLGGVFLEAVWGVADGSLDKEASPLERRTALRLYSLLVAHEPRDLLNRKEALIALLDTPRACDNVMIGYGFSALEKEYLVPHFTPIPAAVNPTTHPVLRALVVHLCRPTSHVPSWMTLAEAGINAIHHLCEAPAVVYCYVLQHFREVACVAPVNDRPNARAQFFFILGSTALKGLVSIDTYERQQLRLLDDGGANAERGRASGDDRMDADTMHKELGFGSVEYRRHEICQAAQKRRQGILHPESIWGMYAPLVVETCMKKPDVFEAVPYLRLCAVLALCKLLVVSESFCAAHLHLLFSIAAGRRETWAVKTNVVVALGDLACVHPNLLNPYLRLASHGFFKLLADDDLRVRAVTIQVCSHLVLGDMLRVRDHLFTVVRLVADPDKTIAGNAIAFVRNLAVKEKDKIGNLIPPLVPQLSHCMPEAAFQLAMRTLLERVEGDKPTDSLIERLCDRFEPYSERGVKKRQFARNLAFCLAELNYATERAVKRITSEVSYNKYRQWLRDEAVLAFFRGIAAKAKRSGLRSTGVTERRDRAAIDEWEARMTEDAATGDSGPAEPTALRRPDGASDADSNGGSDEEEYDPQTSVPTGSLIRGSARQDVAEGGHTTLPQRKRMKLENEV